MGYTFDLGDMSLIYELSAAYYPILLLSEVLFYNLVYFN